MRGRYPGNFKEAYREPQGGQPPLRVLGLRVFQGSGFLRV